MTHPHKLRVGNIERWIYVDESGGIVPGLQSTGRLHQTQ